MMKTNHQFTPWLSCRVAGLALAYFLAAAAGTHADTIYVSNWNNSTIEKYDSDTGSRLGIFNIGGPQGLALDSAGNLYAVEWTSSSIVKYTPTGVRSVFATSL